MLVATVISEIARSSKLHKMRLMRSERPNERTLSGSAREISSVNLRITTIAQEAVVLDACWFSSWSSPFLVFSSGDVIPVN